MKKQETDQGAPPAQSKLIIDRSRWLRGEGKGMLLRSLDGKMCCLGFFGLACGIPGEVLRDQGLPAETKPDGWPHWLVDYQEPDYGQPASWEDSQECDRLIQANDSEILTAEDREQKIARIFKRHGVTVEFVEDAAEPQS